MRVPRIFSLRALFSLGLWTLFSLPVLGFAETAPSNTAPEHEIILNPTSNAEGDSYILFVNLNTSRQELRGIRTFAQEKGLGLVMIPSLNTVKTLGLKYDEFISANRDYDEYNARCANSPNTCNPARLKSLFDRKEALDNQCITLADKHPMKLRRELETVFQELRGKKITHVVFSGHNSEGGFSGDYLSIHAYLHRNFITLAKKYSDLFTDWTYFALWGCASVVTENIETFVAQFPSIKIFAGFADTAPSGERAESGNFLGSITSKATAMLSAHTGAELKRIIESSKSIFDLYSAVYAQISTGEKFIFAITSDPNGGPRFQRYGVQNCASYMNSTKGTSFQKDMDLVEQYFDGTLDIPGNTSKSPLRDAYYRLMRNSSCYDHTKYLSPVQVGMLRFFDGVRTNFDKTFDKEIRLVQREMPGLNLDDLISGGSREEIRQFSEKLKTRAEEHSHSAGNSFAKLSLLIDRYLIQLDPDCLDFLEWHEAKKDDPESHTAFGACKLQWNPGSSENNLGYTWKIVSPPDDEE